MRRPVRAAAAALALGVGGGVAYLTRTPTPRRPNARPAAVERVVRALDRRGPPGRDDLTAALDAAGAPSGFASPWREELDLARLVNAGDAAALEAFARAEPPCPARARAWLWLASERTGADRQTAYAEWMARYPESAAARLFAARTPGLSK